MSVLPGPALLGHACRNALWVLSDILQIVVSRMAVRVRRQSCAAREPVGDGERLNAAQGNQSKR
jgi:hypothetical protein